MFGKIGDALFCTVSPESLGHWRYINGGFIRVPHLPSCCAADQEEPAYSPITLPDYRLMAQLLAQFTCGRGTESIEKGD